MICKEFKYALPLPFSIGDHCFYCWEHVMCSENNTWRDEGIRCETMQPKSCLEKKIVIESKKAKKHSSYVFWILLQKIFWNWNVTMCIRNNNNSYSIFISIEDQNNKSNYYHKEQISVLRWTKMLYISLRGKRELIFI